MAGVVSSEVKSIAVSPGEYLVSHVVNGEPLIPLTSSNVDQLVGQPPALTCSVSDYAKQFAAVARPEFAGKVGTVGLVTKAEYRGRWSAGEAPHIIGVAQSTVGGHNILPEKYVLKIGKMPEFYMLLARKIIKIPEFLLHLSEKFTKFPNFT